MHIAWHHYNCASVSQKANDQLLTICSIVHHKNSKTTYKIREEKAKLKAAEQDEKLRVTAETRILRVESVTACWSAEAHTCVSVHKDSVAAAALLLPALPLIIINEDDDVMRGS